jgi:hypothetical protein
MLLILKPVTLSLVDKLINDPPKFYLVYFAITDVYNYLAVADAYARGPIDHRRELFGAGTYLKDVIVAGSAISEDDVDAVAIGRR